MSHPGSPSYGAHPRRSSCYVQLRIVETAPDYARSDGLLKPYTREHTRASLLESACYIPSTLRDASSIRCRLSSCCTPRACKSLTTRDICTAMAYARRAALLLITTNALRPATTRRARRAAPRMLLDVASASHVISSTRVSRRPCSLLGPCPCRNHAQRSTSSRKPYSFLHAQLVHPANVFFLFLYIPTLL